MNVAADICCAISDRRRARTAAIATSAGAAGTTKGKLRENLYRSLGKTTALKT